MNEVKSIIAVSNEIFNFITDEYLQKRIILECFNNKTYRNYVMRQITILKGNSDDKTINKVFNDIHSKTLKYLSLGKEKIENNYF